MLSKFFSRSRGGLLMPSRRLMQTDKQEQVGRDAPFANQLSQWET